MDASHNIISVAPDSATTVRLPVAPGTPLLKRDHTVALGDFAAGDAVVVRYTIRADGSAITRAVADTASAWRLGTRPILEGILAAPITQSVQVKRADGVAFAFAVGAKTKLLRGGAPVAPSAFAAGAHVYVLLRSGGVNAPVRTVSDREIDLLPIRKKTRTRTSAVSSTSARR